MIYVEIKQILHVDLKISPQLWCGVKFVYIGLCLKNIMRFNFEELRVFICYKNNISFSLHSTPFIHTVKNEEHT